MNKPGITFGMQTVLVSDVHRNRPRAYMIFSTCSSNTKWRNLGFMLVANVVAIGIATLVNNMSNKRQYPMSWGIPASLSSSLWLKNKAVVPATTFTALSRRTSLVVPKEEPQAQTQRWYHKFSNNTIIHA
jgi:hypothetical protein